MASTTGYDDIPIISKLPSGQAATKLREVGEIDTAEILESAEKEIPQTYGTWALISDKPWQHTAHTLGYLAPALPNSRDLPIQSASNIVPDLTLKGDRPSV